jgi:hypothetical protein
MGAAISKIDVGTGLFLKVTAAFECSFEDNLMPLGAGGLRFWVPFGA